MNCTSLQTLVLPENVTTLGDSTFEGCTALQNITFSTKLQSLGRATFRGCDSLAQVLFPESTTIIGNDTFLETTSVHTLRMHRDVWETIVQTLDLHQNADRQLVTFYQEPDTVYSRNLEIQRDHYAFDRISGMNTNVGNNILLLLGNGDLTQL
jgi:hypothetical protein